LFKHSWFEIFFGVWSLDFGVSFRPVVIPPKTAKNQRTSAKKCSAPLALNVANESSGGGGGRIWIRLPHLEQRTA
jgi:hypothetical protein